MFLMLPAGFHLYSTLDFCSCIHDQLNKISCRFVEIVLLLVVVVESGSNFVLLFLFTFYHKIFRQNYTLLKWGILHGY